MTRPSGSWENGVGGGEWVGRGEGRIGEEGVGRRVEGGKKRSVR